jgi:uncharacterized protein (TIGR03905 family)
MNYTYYPKGVCSTKITVEIEEGVIKKLAICNGCSGNLQGITRLAEGMRVEEAIDKLRGIKCGPKPTSCPDQLSIALEKAWEQYLRGQSA